VTTPKDDLADTYARGRAEDHEGIHEFMDCLMNGLADVLGESPEAWRGAEMGINFCGHMIVGVAPMFVDRDDADALVRAFAILTGSFLDHPCARAERANRKETE